MRRGGGLLELIWNTPWLLAIVALVIVLGIAFWIWEQVQEHKEGEKLREADRRHNDSIWKE